MRTRLLQPRLATIDIFASTLLVALGAGSQAGCSTDVTRPDDVAGAGGGGAASSTTTTGTSTATGVGGGGTSTSATTSTTSTSTTGAGGGSGGCVNPTPVIVAGQDTGVDRCDGGQLRRREAIECPTNYPDTNPCCGGCPEGSICNTAGEVACSCVTACTSDDQCAAGELCLCGDPAGVCVPAKCQGAEDCGPGGECTSWDMTQGCLYLEFVCTTPADTCGGDLDCSGINTYCTVQADGHRECIQGGCAIGRPFLVDSEVRTAGLARRADWRDGRVVPDVRGIDDLLRLELAEAWEHTARMEHASIAAFARFSLQLLALGAPPDLLERTHRAMADETQHARSSFALASAYRGRDVGPGALRIDGALEGGNDLAAVARLLVREGCVGETVAAFEAGEAREHASDPAVRDVLHGIAGDESAHAELAWCALRWALEAPGGEVRAALLDEIAILERELLRAPSHEKPSMREEALLGHGVVQGARRSEIRRAVLRRVVLPCLRALTGGVLAAAA